jgi:DNA-binding response OmpR family regulator
MSWIRRIDEAKDVPFVVITGGEPEKYKARALAAGATGFFHKPIDNDELLNVIGRTLAEAGAEEPVT